MKNILKAITILIIGIIAINLCSCAAKQHHLTIDASIISKGQTKNQVIELIGEPDYITNNTQNEEEWYYYHDITPFWRKIPLFGRLLGEKEVEAIQITFYHEHVSKVIYYVTSK